jgi:hypothetical protein
LQQQHSRDGADAGEPVGEREARHHGPRHRDPEQPRAIAWVDDQAQLAAEVQQRYRANRGERGGAGAEEQRIEMDCPPSRDDGLAGADDRVDDA